MWRHYNPGAALQPIAGKPAPTGIASTSRPVQSLWELACLRWAAKRPRSINGRKSSHPPCPPFSPA
ncbi:hypothetical protein AL532_26745 [Pseudomonas monteilii]|nr:hypothetical protein AL532_26745 [Pseudomonas monteilii]QIG17676.1 hypothetical protein FY041_07835 [Pseudomonas monteilii]QIG22933.1 hypothetical protein FY043_07830 [Pseudomonas monteilii]